MGGTGGRIVPTLKSKAEIDNTAKEETQRMLNAVQHERDKLLALVNSIADEVWFADTEKKFTLANPSALREFGFGFTDEIDVEKLAESLKVYRPDGSPRPAEEAPPLRALQGEVVRNQEEIIQTPASGELRYRQVSASPVRDATGKIIGSVSVVRDITEGKRMEEELRRSRDELEMRVQERTAELRSVSLYARSLIETSLDPLVTISVDGKVMDVNRATELVTGVARDQLIGSDFSDYFTEPEKAREGYKQVFSEGFVRDYPLAIRHTSGRRIEVLYNATVYNNEAGEVQGVFAAARDITERKRTEEALQATAEALREREKRLSDLSTRLLRAQEEERKRIAGELHDTLGSYLGGIKFKVESAMQEIAKTPKAATESLNAITPVIQEAIEECRRIQQDLRPSMLDDLGLLPTLSWFCRRFQTLYSGIRVDKEVVIEESEVPPPLKIVVFRITQEAMNNVAKHSKANIVRLCLRKTDGRMELVVEDNGRGIDLEKILDPKSARRGLGLTNMRERTELSGGSFVIESIPGSGTTLRVSWPLER
jgi:PAS domain S-box-containing protein